MAQFFKAKPNSSKQLSTKLTLEVTDLDHLGSGIAQHQGKIVFIPGALPTEQVLVQLVEQKKRFSRAKLLKVLRPANARVKPVCRHYQQCGGCDLQHFDLENQRHYKAKALGGLIEKMGQTQALHQSAALIGSELGYRRRARLASHYQKDTQKLTLGFRAKASDKVVSIDQCPVLDERLSVLIAPLTAQLNRLNVKKSLGHVELIAVESGLYIVLRITKPVADKERVKLSEFAAAQNVSMILLGEHAAMSFINGDEVKPFYQLSDGLELSFSPGNFIQVNRDINQAMVTQAIEWLAPKPGERVLDLFCGVGNFSLPLAQTGAEVVGVEGVVEMVEQGRANARHNGIDNVQFFHADLSADISSQPWLGKVDKMLLDPARAGAFESLQWLKKMKPQRVVYVSCNPASLARDSQPLTEQGYQLTQLGLIDMFPQTHHIEAMALFELK
ncbi:23S rRNA (uracil(1939)-C(5))-methyltransferase RlmD [Shewanella sp. Scap07]|uniref:23S rRNA (uracil(1939)-C(5))-methyltransferase RlmD n=1 Tax=Shewanella sp. Scap07 TaxID=2589987 RepID=UPI0015BE3E43|nr:23S rRNA (uracil(1939)-C(5))-methyltransferase RlmD [Shewanella sp. Scap07]QLE84756.1 23S rRNA (uracil(1939)-C(5))-methyltransferase RlmD [Shewanella sp. Scap07]